MIAVGSVFLLLGVGVVFPQTGILSFLGIDSRSHHADSSVSADSGAPSVTSPSPPSTSIQITNAQIVQSVQNGQPYGATASFVAPANPVLYVTYVNANPGNEHIFVTLLNDGNRVSGCTDMILNTTSGNYWCAINNSALSAGNYQFQLYVNGGLVGTYLFVVESEQQQPVEPNDAGVNVMRSEDFQLLRDQSINLTTVAVDPTDGTIDFTLQGWKNAAGEEDAIMNLVAANGAQSAVMGSDEPGYQQCAAAPLKGDDIIGVSEFGSGTWLCVKTQAGNIAKLRVNQVLDGRAGILFSITVWQ
jgi:hypothetical protein